MNIKFENNDKWTAKERKKIKKRAITIIVLLSIIAVSAVSFFTINYFRKTKGLFYPNVTLQDSVTGAEPQILQAEGYEQVLKAPTLPYTLLTKGEVVTDSDAFCVFLIDGMYAAVAEIPKNAETCQYIKTAIMPSLNGSVNEITSFKKQTGYLNERQVESQGTTITLSNGADVYAMNIRVFLPEEKDILISVISSNTNMKNAEEVAENIFYSLRQLEDSQSSTNIDTSNLGGISIEDLENITGGMDHDTDNEASSEANSPNPHIDNYENEWKIDEENGYIEGETYTFECTARSADCEWLAFAFTLSTEMLEDIYLQSPDGTTYYPDEIRRYQFGYAYGFHVGTGQTGQWTFVWTAKSSIGEYFDNYTTDENWNKLLLIEKCK